MQDQRPETIPDVVLLTFPRPKIMKNYKTNISKGMGKPYRKSTRITPTSHMKLKPCKSCIFANVYLSTKATALDNLQILHQETDFKNNTKYFEENLLHQQFLLPKPQTESLIPHLVGKATLLYALSEEHTLLHIGIKSVRI